MARRRGDVSSWFASVVKAAKLGCHNKVHPPQQRDAFEIWNYQERYV